MERGTIFFFFALCDLCFFCACFTTDLLFGPFVFFEIGVTSIYFPKKKKKPRRSSHTLSLLHLPEKEKKNGGKQTCACGSGGGCPCGRGLYCRLWDWNEHGAESLGVSQVIKLFLFILVWKYFFFFLSLLIINIKYNFLSSKVFPNWAQKWLHNTHSRVYLTEKKKKKKKIIAHIKVWERI